MPTETLAVTINALGGWTNNGGANATVSVALADDGDTSYIKDVAATNDVVNYDVNNCVTITGADTINSVTVRVRCRVESDINNSGEVRMSSNSWTNQLTSILSCNTTYVDYTGLNSTTRPQGGSWTLADVNALVLRILGDDFQALRVTTFTVDVDYTVASVNNGDFFLFF